MKKTLLCVLCFLFILSGTFAQFSINKIDAGGNLGANMNSREGWAFTFGAHGDYEIIENLKAGLQLGFSFADDMFVFEPSVYGKYYLPFLSFFGFTPFAQLDLGASVIAAEKNYGRFLFGIGAGARYEIGKLYVEPKLTWGYPFMLAVNASVGYSF